VRGRESLYKTFCHTCAFATPSALTVHLLVHDKPYSCDACGKERDRYV
jgi:hypothetical protein